LAVGWSLVGWRIAPDGRTVAVLRYTETDWTKQQLYFDLTVLPLDGAPSRVLARRLACGFCFSWSPDGRRIAYSTSERAQPVRVFVVPADGAHGPAELTDGQDAGLDGEYEAPRWDPGGEHVYCLGWRGLGVFAADATARRRVAVPERYEVLGWAQRPTDALCRTADGAVVLLLRDAVRQNLVVARTALEGGRTTVLAELPKRWSDRAFGVDVAPDGDPIYLTLEAAEHPAEVWRLDGRAGEPRRLAALNPDVRDLALGASRLVEWRSPDGAVRRGALVLPPGYAEGQRVPVVVDVYLGRMGSRGLHQFGGGGSLVHAQVLASRGYAVLSPDMPAVDRDPLRRVAGQVLPALDRLVELGIADPARLGAIGHSYGGYCVQALLTQTGRLGAAVCSAGFTNLTSTYGALSRDGHSMELGWLETAPAGMGGPLWERRDAYVENSPLFHLDRVTTPLLLVCGGVNPGEVSQAGEAFSALRRLGQRVELRVYRGEGHRIGVWSEASYRDLCDRVLAWFDTFLTAR
jgi:dipeptidyl aminopeptidase/acylaminoacyl peptidase